MPTKSMQLPAAQPGPASRLSSAGSSIRTAGEHGTGAALNDAYATLQKPLRRAEYLLGLVGGPSASEYKEMSPAFLDEMLELRMEIEELRERGSHDSPGRQRWNSNPCAVATGWSRGHTSFCPAGINTS